MTHRPLYTLLYFALIWPLTLALANETNQIQVVARNMYIETALISKGQAAAVIVIPKNDAWYATQAARIVAAVKKSGAELKVETDDAWSDIKTLDQNLILLGDRDSNRAIKKLYYLHYTLLDARYPGVDGSVLRSLHNPFGDGHNIILVGGSDHIGVSRAVDDLIDELDKSTTSENLQLGYLQKIQLGQGLTPPADAKDATLWAKSKGYGNRGYFGWNLISRHLALFHMTGDTRYAEEFLRVAFPDKDTVQELIDFDKEAYDDPSDPIAKPYHYQAIMMILYWDLVEEHPFFSEADRLRVTQKFADQFAYDHPAKQASPATILRDRHELWRTLCQYALARYFAKASPSAEVDAALQDAANIMDPFKHRITMRSGTFFWYNTYFEPAFLYAALSDPFAYIGKPSVREYGAVLARLSDRSPGNWASRFSTPILLHLIADLTEDQALVDMVSETQQDTTGFRVGQSYQPVKAYPRNTLTEDAGKVIVERFDAEAMQWQSDFPTEEVSEFVVYRQQPDAGGDYLLLDTKYETGRNPFHNFSLSSLRLNGDRLLSGYDNQLNIYCDGLYSSDISLYTHITDATRVGSTVVIRGVISDQNRHQWARTLLLRENRFLLTLDKVTSLEDSDLVEIRQNWQHANSTTAQLLNHGEFQISPKKSTGLTQHYTLATSQAAEAHSIPTAATMQAAKELSRFSLVKPMKQGETVTFATVLRPGAPNPNSPSAAQSVEDQGIFAFRLPNPALLEHGANDGILLTEETHIFGFKVMQIQGLLTADAPVNVDYDYTTKQLSLVGQAGTTIRITVDGAKDRVLTLESDQPIRLDNISVSAQHLSSSQLEAKVATTLASKNDFSDNEPDSAMPAAARLSEDWTLSGSTYINTIQPYVYQGVPCFAVADGKLIRVLTVDGKEIHSIEATDTIGVLYWWEKYQLLLVGTRDEKLRAFDTLGKERWTHTAEMAAELVDSQKFYWFKKPIPGVIALCPLALPNGTEVMFVGGAGTAEIIDGQGQFQKRFWQTWGAVDGFTSVTGADGRPRMLGRRSMGGWPTVFEVSYTSNGTWEQRDMGRTMTHDMAGMDMGSFGFSMVGRNFLTAEELVPGSDAVLVGDFNGAHNRLLIWNMDGTPIREVNLGPGFTATGINGTTYGRASERDLNVRGLVVLDLDGDGFKEIVVAMNGGYVLAFDHELKSKFVLKLQSAPTLLTTIERSGEMPLLAVADVDGNVHLLNAQGKTVAEASVDGRPTVVFHADNQLLIGTATGEMTAFKLPELTSASTQKGPTVNNTNTTPRSRPYQLAELNAQGIPPLLAGVSTREEWAAKNAEIRAVWLEYLGGLPQRPKPAIRVISEEHLADHIRRKIVYDTVYGDTVPALLLLPLDVDSDTAKKSAVLALHPTNAQGKESVATPEGRHNRMYALELVRRGYVVLAPDAMTSGERILPGHSHFDSSPFEAQHPNWSTVGKNLTDHLQAMDVLCALPEVDAERVGVIGHSFGAYNAYFLSSVDERVKAVVSSCGVCPFTRTQDLPHWGKRDYPYTHFPRISEDTARGVVPFEFNEIIALTAPRPQFFYAAQSDRYFQNWREVGDVFADERSLYQFLSKPENFVSFIGVGPHDFPPEVRLMAYNFLDRNLRQ